MVPPPTIFEEYEAHLKRSIDEYGDNTVVLMEVGSFFELYAVDDSLVDLFKIGSLLNVQVTRKNKSIQEVNKSNHLLAGFPSYCLEKFTNILLDNLYTVVIVSQVTPPPKPQRKITSILSPGTRVDASNAPDNSFLMCITLDVGDNTLLAGVAYVDVSTGSTYVTEIGASTSGTHHELQRILLALQPKEILLRGSMDHSALDAFIAAVPALSLSHLHRKMGTISNANQQKQILETAYPKHGLLTVVEYIDLERRPLALQCFVNLLCFAHRHREDILNNIHKPIFVDSREHLVISHNASKLLDIIPRNEGKSLLDLLNRCKTNIGKRGFRRRLLNPIIDAAALNTLYEQVDMFLAGEPGAGEPCEPAEPGAAALREVRTALSSVSDLERIMRRACLGSMNPSDIIVIDDSLTTMLKVDARVPFRVARIADKIHEIRQCATVFNFERIASATGDVFSRNIFHPKVHPDLDAMDDDLRDCISYFENVVKELNGIAKSDTFFKLDRHDKEGYVISATAKRFATFGAQHAHTLLQSCGIRVDAIKSRATSSSSPIVKLSHEAFKTANANMEDSEARLKQGVKQRYFQYLDQFSKQHDADMRDIIQYIELVDVVTTNAENAVTYCYCRPRIHASGTPSFVNARQLRHPIIERIKDDIAYVPNDVYLGPQKNGMLMFGVNAAGKSSLMKSVGLSLIMACSGMFVPCHSFEFSPYNKIFTRIPSGDDLHAGHSTFTNEISELRTIMLHADANSLVIGDELCSGTEPVSAMAIVTAGIVSLMQKNTSFIFASHLHSIVDLPHLKDLKAMGSLNICHLGVRYDGSKLIYDRVLRDGCGDTLYGIEVCRAMDLDPQFMRVAQEIRQHVLNIEPDIVVPKKTRYNSKLFKSAKCKLCKTGRAAEVHHIAHQQKADKNGHIDKRFHKNALHNLVHLCETCHDSVHAGQITIDGYVQTSDGVEILGNFGE